MFCVYLLQCSDKTLYCGITTDIVRRLREHNSGKGAKYIRSRLPVELLCVAGGDWTRSQASRIEAQIKKLPKKEKEKELNKLLYGQKQI